MRVGAGFVSLLGGINWIGGVADCGIAGFLSLIGLFLAFVSNEYADAAVSDVTESESEAPIVQREEVYLQDGTHLKQHSSGLFLDERSHEWKKDKDGKWYDDGFRL